MPPRSSEPQDCLRKTTLKTKIRENATFGNGRQALRALDVHYSFKSALSALSATSLENAVPSYSNALEVYDIRFVGSEREINASEGTFEDIFNLEVHLREA